jgi:hypothetical protein
MFEAVINAVHRAAPDAAIAFNTGLEDSADAAEQQRQSFHGRPEPQAQQLRQLRHLAAIRRASSRVSKRASTVRPVHPRKRVVCPNLNFGPISLGMRGILWTDDA